MDYTDIDRRADELLALDYTPQQAWRVLCREHTTVHSGVIAERVAAAAIDAGVAI